MVLENFSRQSNLNPSKFFAELKVHKRCMVTSAWPSFKIYPSTTYLKIQYPSIFCVIITVNPVAISHRIS